MNTHGRHHKSHPCSVVPAPLLCRIGGDSSASLGMDHGRVKGSPRWVQPPQSPEAGDLFQIIIQQLKKVKVVRTRLPSVGFRSNHNAMPPPDHNSTCLHNTGVLYCSRCMVVLSGCGLSYRCETTKSA